MDKVSEFREFLNVYNNTILEIVGKITVKGKEILNIVTFTPKEKSIITTGIAKIKGVGPGSSLVIFSNDWLFE